MDPKIEELKDSIQKIKDSMGDFFVSGGRKKIDESSQMRFIVQQLNSMLGEVEELDRAVSLGIPLTEYEGNISKLSKLERELLKMESQMNSLLSRMEDLERDRDELNLMIKEGLSERQVKLLENRIKNLEELQKKLLSSKSTRIVIELVKVVDMLNRRVKHLEDLVAITSEEEITPSYSRYELGKEKPEQKRGLLSKFFSIFNSLKKS